MAKQVQLRRGTTAELSSVTGAIGEVIVDTTKDTLTVHDGYTAGGTPLLKEDLGNLANNSIGLGKIATGTHGQVLYYNASGQLTTLAPGSSGQFLKTNGSGQNPQWGTIPPAGILYTHHFEDATRNISISASNYGVPIQFTFTKQSATSVLVVIGRTPISEDYSHQTGEFMEISGTRKYEAAHFIAPTDPGSDSRYGTIFWNAEFSGKSTGSHTVSLGWNVRSGSTGERPGYYWNPDQRSGRAWARTTVITIFEVESTLVSTIT